ncbi:propanediol utilization microcompartment protein PduB [Thermosediminibacter litoriperuensis]|uniref:Microcompartment protein PduB n=1 Tax=Thermosediminibacter litoriperuensis TaxID=291989 RepID=A0A5S5ATQ9_9FIRM|nr:propanediol utilization microcompartment protein PduB [Thermosediminibacter litoriperuensis]TYP55466.1 microcompartment protein PduB [Thermosediminibacter litoriperuensis]
MDELTIKKLVKEIIGKVDSEEKKPVCPAVTNPGVTEFVGTAIGDTIGLVIANIDSKLLEKTGLDKRFRSIGILGGRTGAGPQIMAADEAVKATNTEIVAVELARDTKGGAGHGSLIIFGAEEVSDARRAVEVALKELPRTFGDVYVNDAGHLEFQYTARASYAIEKAFGAPLGKAFGLIVGAPAAIGVVCCDTAVKAAEVDIVGYASPAKGTSFTNEAILFLSGESGAVRQALIAAREIGKKLLATLGEEPKSLGTPYI